MAGEERRSYLIVRRDGFLLHTKPVTLDEARWLYWDAYFARFVGRAARARYLAEWGNVLDVGEHLERLEHLEPDIYYSVLGLYRGPGRFAEKAGRLLRGLQPEARRALEELLDRVGEFLQRPIEPKPAEGSVVRYYEMEGRHVELGPDGAAREVRPMPEWYACKELCCGGCHGHGVSVFGDSFWLWRQSRWYVQAVVVRRDARDGDVVAALAKDEAAQGFLGESADDLMQLLREYEAELASRGYGDVARKVKVVLAAARLLAAGREEEALTA